MNNVIFLFSSDRTVKIWRARGGLDSTLESADNADDVASNWTQRPLQVATLEGLLKAACHAAALHFDP